MTAHSLFRLSAIAAIFAGVLNPLVDLIAPSDNSWLQWGYFLGGVALQLALVGIYAIQARETGILGLLGFVFAFVGRAYFSVPTEDVGGIDGTAPLGLIYTIGFICLALASLSARKIPRLAPLLWLIAVIFGLTGAIIPAAEAALLNLGAISLGLGFIATGYSLWTRNLAA